MDDPVLVETTRDEGTLSVKCRLSYTAEISYDDPDMTVHSEGESSLNRVGRRLIRVALEVDAKPPSGFVD